MSRNNDNTAKRKITFASLMANNKVLFAFSVVVAVVFWCLVSMSQTTEIERVFQNVKVTINMEESLPKNSGLEIFGNDEFFVDVSVKGLSYLVNDSAFSADNISVLASCSAVSAAGTYELPLSYSLKGVSEGIEIVNTSATSVKVTFDERVTKTFALTEDIEETEGYSLGEGLIRENPRLSTDSVEISGPSREVSKITAVKAHAVLSEELTSTVTLEAELIAESASGTLDFSYFTVKNADQIYITIPVNQVGTYKTAVDFIGLPQAYRGEGIEYTITPSEIEVSVHTGVGETQINDSNEILVGTVDFSQINNTTNRIVVENNQLLSEPVRFTVTVDMSSMQKRWLEIPVDLTDVKLPDGATVTSATVKSVQIIGPYQSVMKLDKSAAYAVPVFDKASYSSGTHKVPVKIVLRTLTDSWVYGTYTIDITVE